MKKASKLIKRLSAIIPAMALVIGVIAANSACIIYYHQPKVPDAMSAYRR